MRASDRSIACCTRQRHGNGVQRAAAAAQRSWEQVRDCTALEGLQATAWYLTSCSLPGAMNILVECRASLAGGKENMDTDGASAVRRAPAGLSTVQVRSWHPAT